MQLKSRHFKRNAKWKDAGARRKEVVTVRKEPNLLPVQQCATIRLHDSFFRIPRCLSQLDYCLAGLAHSFLCALQSPRWHSTEQ